MNFNNMVKNRYVQAFGAILAFMCLFWLVSVRDIAANENTSDVVGETHKVFIEGDTDPLEIFIEGEVPSTE